MSPIVIPLTSGGSGPSSGGNSSLQIGRLLLAPPLQWYEQLGSPITNLGGAVVPNTRTAPQYQLQISTAAADGQTDTQTARLALRRQLRSLLNNDKLKFEYAYLYIQYSDDPEQNGWFVPDQGSLQDLTGAIGLATGWWNLQANWMLVGHRRTHREARAVWMKQLNLSTPTYPRDTLGWIISADFSTLPALALSALPSGATSAILTVSGQVVSGPPLPTGRDGGICQIIQGLTDLAVVSYERLEASLNLSDVIAYDRMGQITAPATGPDTSWLEVYGPDWPWNWQASGQPADMPVLDNGLIRIRYDASTGDPGFRIDVWNGTAYIEQGKVTVYRIGDVSGYCNTFISAGLHTDNQNGGWTPDRAVVKVVLANSADANSREQVFVTLQRGALGARFEVYPALKANGSQADAQLTYTMNGPDSNDSVFWEPSTAQPPASATDQVWSTISSNWTSAAGTFSSSTSNLLAILRCQGGASTVGAYQVNLSVVQQGAQFVGASENSAYGGSNQNALQVKGAGGLGYLQLNVGYVATQSDQVQTGTLTSWSSSQASQYRVFNYHGATPVWSDAGEYTGTAVSFASSTWALAFQTQDRTRTAAILQGARDQAQAALTDSRMLGAVVVR